MDSASGKFCPVCKHKNEPDATVCSFCGAFLPGGREIQPETLRVKHTKEKTKILPEFTEEAFQKAFKPPEEGIAIYVKEFAAPIAIRKEAEFTLGRLLTEGAEQAFVDLKPFGGL